MAHHNVSERTCEKLRGRMTMVAELPKNEAPMGALAMGGMGGMM